MSISLIEDCWSSILSLDRKQLLGGCQPLSHIEPLVSHLGLSPFSGLSPMAGGIADPAPSNPSFRDLTDEILFTLRQHIYSDTNHDSVSHWAEKLMRFCEIRYPTLRKRAVQKCGTRAAARLHILHLASFLMDHAIATGDMRFLNTVLKLADLRWLIDPRRLRSEIGQKREDLTTALFQFRILLFMEYAIATMLGGFGK